MVNSSSGKQRPSVGFYDEAAARGHAVGLKTGSSVDEILRKLQQNGGKNAE